MGSNSLAISATCRTPVALCMSTPPVRNREHYVNHNACGPFLPRVSRSVKRILCGSVSKVALTIDLLYAPLLTPVASRNLLGSCWIPGSYTLCTGLKHLILNGFFQRCRIGRDPRGKPVKTTCYAKLDQLRPWNPI